MRRVPINGWSSLEDPALQDNPATTVPAVPDYVTNYRSQFRHNPVTNTLVAPANIFPLGFYSGIDTTTPTFDFIVDDMMALNCNVIHGNNIDITALGTVLNLLDGSPLKLVYEGGSSGSLFYEQANVYFGGDIQQEIFYNAANFIPAALADVPQYQNRPGLLAWSLSEELAPNVPQRMYEYGYTDPNSGKFYSYYNLMRMLDPTHPPPAAQQSDGGRRPTFTIIFRRKSPQTITISRLTRTWVPPAPQAA